MLWKWRICLVFAGFMISFIADGAFYSFGVILPELLKEFQEGESKTSWVGSLNRGHIQLIGLVVGPLTKQFGCPVVAAIGSVLASFALVLSAFAINLWYLYFSYGVLGGCAAGFCIHPAVIATTISFKEHRGLAVGIVTAGSGTGNFVLAAASYYLIESFGWRGCILICSGVVTLVLIFSFFLKPRNPSPCCCGIEVSDSNIPVTTTSVSTSTEEPTPGWCAVFLAFFNFYLLTEIRFFLICIGGAVVSLGLFIPSMFIVRFAQSIGMDNQRSAFLLSLMGINNTLSRVLSGLITDQSWGNILIVYILGMFIAGVSTLIVGFLDTFVTLAIYSCIFGYCMGCVLSLRSTIVFELMGLELFHDAFGMYLLFTGIAAFLGPPLFGYIYEWTSSFKITFLSSGIVVLAGMLFWCVIPCVTPLRRCFGFSPERS